MTTLEDLWLAAYDPAVSRHLTYPGGSLIDLLEQSALANASRPAMDFFGRRTSYAKMIRQIRLVANSLYRLGVRPGDNVALLMPTCSQHVLAFYAVLMCGATVVEHNPLYTSRELAPLFADHRATVAIVWDAAAAHLGELPEDVRPEQIIAINMIETMPVSKQLLLKLPIGKARTSRNQLSTPAPGTIPFSELLIPCPDVPDNARPSPDDIALMLYTSGTTGTPKGVPLTHKNLVATTRQSIEWVTDLTPGHDVFLACLPLFHVFGCSLSMNLGLMTGAMVHLIPKPETGLMLDAISRATPTMVVAVPPLFERMIAGAKERGVSLKGIRTGFSGAMPLKAELVEAWEEATGGLLIEGYGLSECSPIVAGNPVNTTRTAGAIGIPFPDTEVRLTDPDDPTRDVAHGQPGEILVKGPQVFAGYRGRGEETEAAFSDSWFRTGDVAVADERGFLRIVDRIKEVVITGGFNVYPSEVEEAMRGYDGIEDIAVIGLANDLGVEEVVAAVVTANGIKPEIDQLRRSVKKRLAAYKVPRRVFVVEDLPRNAMGKVLRRDVRLRLEQAELSHKLSELAPEMRARLMEIGPDLREWLNELGPMVSETIEAMAPEAKKRWERIEHDLRARLEDFAPELRLRLDQLDLPKRLEVLFSHSSSHHPEGQTIRHTDPEDQFRLVQPHRPH